MLQDMYCYLCPLAALRGELCDPGLSNFDYRELCGDEEPIQEDQDEDQRSLVFVLVFLNGFFVAAEFAIVKVRETRVSELASEGGKRAQIAVHILEHLDAYLSATQLGITMASLGLGWIGEPALAHILSPPLGYLGITSDTALHTASAITAFAFITFLHIVLGELVPKSIAIRAAERTS